MRFVSPTQPYCRCCGKPIKKFTLRHSFGKSEYKDHGWSISRTEKPMSKEELQRAVNGRIISFTWDHNTTYDANYEPVRTKTFIGEANVWDGETYEAQFFCTMRCAAAFGEMAAREYPGLHTQTYADAMRKREG